MQGGGIFQIKFGRVAQVKTVEKQTAAARMWSAGELSYRIAGQLGVRPRTVYRWMMVWQAVRMETPYEVIAHWTFYSVAGGAKAGEGGESGRAASAGEGAVRRATLIERGDGPLVDTEDGAQRGGASPPG